MIRLDAMERLLTRHGGRLCVASVCCLFLIPNFFSVAQQNWFGEPRPAEVIDECARWFTSYCVLGSFLAFINTGMIFTRFGSNIDLIREGVTVLFYSIITR